MSKIDLLSLKPHKISRDLKEKIFYIYGDPKTGKTTIATQFPNALLLAFEKGYNLLPGVMAQPINTWADFKRVLRQLEQPEVKERFETIVVDTVDIAYDLAEKHICQRHTVSRLGDIKWGVGYAELFKEYDEALRSIPAMGYGLVMISHAGEKTFKDAEGNDTTKIVPTLSKNGNIIVSRMADVYGYTRSVDTEEGTKTMMYLRGTPYFEAGSRLSYIEDYIELSYENLHDAVIRAIEKEEEEGEEVVDTPKKNFYKVEEVDFESVATESREIIKTILEFVKEIEDEEERTATSVKTNAKITEIIDTHLGEGNTLSEATEQQADLIDLVVDDLKVLKAEMGIK